MATYRTASSRQHQASAEDVKSLDRFKKIFGGRPELDTGQSTDNATAVGESYRAERHAILPPDQIKAIRKAVGSATQANGAGRRYLSLTEAKRRGVDLEGLKAVQDRHYRRLSELMNGGGPFSSGEVAALTLRAPFDWPLITMPPEGGAVYVPPFAEAWERWIVNERDGDGRITSNDSYVEEAFGVLGARLVAENHDAGDWNHFDVSRGNGFFVPFTMPVTGILRVSAELICLLCRHHISTSDEWGWSDFWCFTKTACSISVFWDRDGEPSSENVALSLATGLDAHGDGESYPGTVVQVSPGDGRSVDFYTDVAFPAGKTVWIYAGVSNRIFATLNDVSIDVSIDSRWQLSSLTISPL